MEEIGCKLTPQSKILKDIENLMKDIERVDSNLSFQQVPDKVILLLGQTKAGKTTLMYYLLGKKLIRWYNEEFGLFQMKPQAKIFDALIGNDYQSTTVYPNIPTELGEDKVLIIDMPGFSDTRQIYRLLNIYIIREVIKKIRSVHISLVISNETLEGSYLVNIIERNCLLLNHRLVKTPGCISFILTKIEDKEQDLETFKYYLEELKQEKQFDYLSEAMKTIIDAKIYMFENSDPKIEAGVALKARIVAQNSFFQTDEKPGNLLSESYADIISGDQDPQQFTNFIVELLDGVRETLILLIRLFAAAVKLHHLQDFKSISVYGTLQEEELLKQIMINAKSLHASQISSLEISFNENCGKTTQTERLLNLIKKFYIPQKDEINLDLQIFNGDLDTFIEWSKLFYTEESKISKQLRKKIHDLFKFCSKVSKTISHIQQPDITAKFRTFCGITDIKDAIQAYKRISSEPDLIVKIASSPIGSQRLAEIEEFKSILYDLKPNFSFGEFEEVIQNRKVNIRDKIKNKRILQTLQTTKQIEPVHHKHRQSGPGSIILSQITKDAIKTIKNMPLESTHLKNILQLITKFRLQFEQSTDSLKIQFGMTLFRKAAQILEKLELYEEGVLFFLAIPAQIQAERLINAGIDFNEISHDFIKSILLPYYSKWNPNFLMVETLFNYLTLTIFDPTALHENQLQLTFTLQQMHAIDYNQLQPIKRFEFGLLEWMISEEKHYRSHFLERVKHSEERLIKSRITGLQKELNTLKIQ